MRRPVGNDELGDPICSPALGFGRWDEGDVGGIEDQVVAFAIAVGAGDSEVAAGGGQGEDQFGDFSGPFGGFFALEGGFGVGD